jgi:hypothetical protein
LFEPRRNFLRVPKLRSVELQRRRQMATTHQAFERGEVVRDADLNEFAGPQVAAAKKFSDGLFGQRVEHSDLIPPVRRSHLG